jgi:hypothetical protein
MATVAACSRTQNAKTGQALGDVKAAGAATDTESANTLNAAARDADAATRDAEHDAAEVKNAAETGMDKAGSDLKADARVAREQ